MKCFITLFLVFTSSAFAADYVRSVNKADAQCFVKSARILFPLDDTPMSEIAGGEEKKLFLDGAFEIQTFSGGEGTVYHRLDRPRVAFKLAHPGTANHFSDTIEMQIFAEKVIKSDPDLTAIFEVAHVYERGPDWAVKEFYPKSIPLRDALLDPAVVRKFKNHLLPLDPAHIFEKNYVTKLIKKRLFGNNAKIWRLYGKDASSNLHWDPVKNKIIIIDMY